MRARPIAPGPSRPRATGQPDSAGVGRAETKQETWLPAAPASAGAARSIVREAADAAGLDSGCAWDLMVAASEVVANAIQHGRSWPDQSILLTTQPCTRGLRVEVSNRGTFAGASEPASLEAESGRGFPIIAAVVDHLEVEEGDGRTLVRFERHMSTT
jgi:anti-sigma regulatory factor (Ser/Thr protein kinase)